MSYAPNSFGPMSRFGGRGACGSADRVRWDSQHTNDRGDGRKDHRSQDNAHQAKRPHSTEQRKEHGELAETDAIADSA